MAEKMVQIGVTALRDPSGGFLPSVPLFIREEDAGKINPATGRPVQEESNCWEAPIGEEGASISLDFGKKLVLQQVQLTFDTNLTREIMPSMTRNVRNRQVKGLPEELVCDYDIRFYREGKEVICKEIRGNYQRLNRIVVDNVICDRLTVTVDKAYGIDRERIFEIRTY